MAERQTTSMEFSQTRQKVTEYLEMICQKTQNDFSQHHELASIHRLLLGGDGPLTKIGDDFYINLTPLFPGIEGTVGVVERSPDFAAVHRFIDAADCQGLKFCFSRQMIFAGNYCDIVVGENIEATTVNYRQVFTSQLESQEQKQLAQQRASLESDVRRGLQKIFNKWWNEFLEDDGRVFDTPEAFAFLAIEERANYKTFVTVTLPQARCSVLECLKVASYSEVDLQKLSDGDLGAVLSSMSQGQSSADDIWRLGLETLRVFDNLRKMGDFIYTADELSRGFSDLVLKTPDWKSVTDISERATLLYAEGSAACKLLDFLRRHGNLGLKSISDAQLEIGGAPGISNTIANMSTAPSTQNYAALNGRTPMQAVEYIVSLGKSGTAV